MSFRNPHSSWTPFATLHGFVRLVLLVDWDPIGVFGYAGAMDEYDSYVLGICELLRSEVSREALIAHLNSVEEQSMGLRGEHSMQAVVADKLLLLFQTISQNERRQAKN